MGLKNEQKLYSNRDTRVIVNRTLLSFFGLLHVVLILINPCHAGLIGINRATSYLVNTPLDNETPSSSRDQLLKNLFKVTGNLFECALDGFIFPLIEHFHKLLDGLGRLVQLFTSLEQLITLLSEIVVLFESFLVDMRKLLETLVNCMQLLDELRMTRCQ